MKKIILLSFALLLFVVVGCQKEEVALQEVAQIQETQDYRLDFNFEKADITGTKAVKKGWEEGDTIAMVFNDGNKSGGYYCKSSKDVLLISYIGGKWEVVKNQSVINMLTDSSGGTFSAVYFRMLTDSITAVKIGSGFFASTKAVFASFRGNDLLMKSQQKTYSLDKKNKVISASATFTTVTSNQITIYGLEHSNESSWELAIIADDTLNIGVFRNEEVSVNKNGLINTNYATTPKSSYKTYGGNAANEIVFYCDPTPGTYKKLQLKLIGTGKNADTILIKESANVTIEKGKAYSDLGPGDYSGVPSNGWKHEPIVL